VASPQAAVQGRKPSQNEAYFLRRERTPDDPVVIANRRFHASINGLTICRAFARRRSNTCGPWRGCAAAWCRSMRWRSTCADFFDECFAVPHMILRMSRYPVIDGEDETVASLVPHTDSGFMTLLPPNRCRLSILLRAGRWIDAPGVDGAYVVNGGDILHRWTNERFLSTPHRVRNCSGGCAMRSRSFATRSRHAHQMRAELPLGDNPAKYPPSACDYALWLPQKLRAHGERACPAGRGRRPRPRATACW